MSVRLEKINLNRMHSCRGRLARSTGWTAAGMESCAREEPVETKSLLKIREAF